MSESTAAPGAPWFLQAGGESGAVARAIDWSSTPLGSPDTWPSMLKTTVATILRARQPMFLWWGEELIQLYNDAYLPSFNQGKHPRAMGQRGRECWGEIWPIIGPQIEVVIAQGQGTWDEDALVPIYRHGQIEDVYWTYAYSPVFDETGTVKGVLVTCTETTTRVLAERRSTLLYALVSRTSQAKDHIALESEALEVLGQSPLDIPFAAFVERAEGHEQGAWAITGCVGLTDASVNVLDVALRHGPLPSPMPQSPGGTRPGEAFTTLQIPIQVMAPELAQYPVTQVYIAPFGSSDQEHSLVVLGVSPRLAKDARYRRFFEQIAAQLRADHSRVSEGARRSSVEIERKNLLEHAPVATAFLVGPNHVFELANPLYRQMLNKPDLVGKRYLEAFPEVADTDLPALLDHVYLTGEPYATNELETMIDKGGGKLERCYYKFNLEPVRNSSGQVYGMMAVAVEVTEQVVARLVMEKAHAERERLLRELEQASRAKDEFLAMLGHELRNPLSPILTALELMRLRSGGQATREQEIIQRQAKHLIRLVDDLLDVAKIARGKVELRRAVVDLHDVVTDAAETASYEIERGQHRLVLELEPERFFCFGDRGRLSQVVSNLLTNSARYTPPGGLVTVRCHEENGQLVLRVTDNGVGIAPEMLQGVFNLFEQGARSSDRAQGGLGIGLALVKNLVSLHGGSVSAHSQGPGKGSEFTVRLPVVASGELRMQTESNQPLNLTVSRRVLLVDDNVDAIEMLQVALEAVGHQVAQAADVLKALEVAATFAPDVAILDIGMPVMDGYELATRLRELPSCANCRFIALTGYGQVGDRMRSKAAGFDEHLIKPVNVEHLLAVIEAEAQGRDRY